MGNTSNDDGGRMIIEVDKDLAIPLIKGFNEMLDTEPTNGEVMGALAQVIAEWLSKISETSGEGVADHVETQLFAVTRAMRGKNVPGVQHFEVPGG